MPAFHTPPISPMAIAFDAEKLTLSPEGPTLTRRMSDLEGLFLDHDAWKTAAEGDNPVVYSVVSSPVPEIDRELPQSITTIMPGDTSGELWMTKGHQHPNHQGEIYLALKGRGGLLMFDGERTEWLDMLPGTIGYIPPGWAHRSVNTGDEPYAFLAVYPGGAGHDYGWVLENGMGSRAYRATPSATDDTAATDGTAATVDLRPYATTPTTTPTTTPATTSETTPTSTATTPTPSA